MISFRLFKDRRAVTTLEYGLIASVLFAAVLIGFSMMGNSLSGRFIWAGACVLNGPTSAQCPHP